MCPSILVTNAHVYTGQVSIKAMCKGLVVETRCSVLCVFCLNVVFLGCTACNVDTWDGINVDRHGS